MAQKFHDLLFAKAQFTEAIAHFRCAGEFLDANHRASLHFAQGANGGPGAFAVDHYAGLPFLFFAHRGAG